MTLLHYLGALMVLILIAGVGVYSGSKVKSAADFSTGGRSTGTAMVAGALIGTLVGGASTIGTAQLAFTYGFSAWWFTLGGGIGLVIMALFFAKPMYNSGLTTLPQMIHAEYGSKVATVATVLMSIGTFLSIVSQLLSGVALMTSISSLSSLASTGVIILLMMAYVIFGGVWGAGFAGIVKTLLLYVATLVCGIVSLNLGGGLAAFKAQLPAQEYFNLFARGYLKDGGAGLSLIFGVLTTQSYILPIISAKSIKVSRSGAFIGGILTVLIGVAGIFVGMFMKLNCPGIASSTALPQFVMSYIPAFTGGVILATLLVALVGTGAGLALGISSMLCHDIYQVYLRPDASDKAKLRFSRCVIALVLLIAAVFSFGNLGSMILNWSFMSMGLRGAVAFAPLCFALFLKGRVDSKHALAAVIAGPLCVLASNFILPPEIDALFPGMAVSLIIMLWGYFAGKARR